MLLIRKQPTIALVLEAATLAIALGAATRAAEEEAATPAAVEEAAPSAFVEEAASPAAVERAPTPAAVEEAASSCVVEDEGASAVIEAWHEVSRHSVMLPRQLGGWQPPGAPSLSRGAEPVAGRYGRAACSHARLVTGVLLGLLCQSGAVEAGCPTPAPAQRLAGP